LVPVVVSGVSGATQIATGSSHSCAVVAGGTVECWGNNFNGELGNNTTTNSSVPVAVSGVSGATRIAAGGLHTCAIVVGGAVECWGSNSNGQLGDNGFTFTDSLVPVAVSGVSGATQIATGSSHSCAVVAGGAVECWGDNGSGQLGDNGGSAESGIPVVVSGMSGATQIAAGLRHTCALVAGGGVECWGLNVNGQLGNNSTTNSLVPVAVVGIP